MAGVFHKQRFDVVDVATDLLVVRPAFQGHQGARNDIHEAPGELLEGSGVALVGQLIGDAGRDLGDAGEVTDGVVTRRQFRKAEMKQIKIVQPTGTLRLGVDATQQIGIPFRIEDNDDIAPADVLGNQQFRQACLTDARGAQHQRVPDPFTQIHPQGLLLRFNRVQGGLAADGR